MFKFWKSKTPKSRSRSRSARRSRSGSRSGSRSRSRSRIRSGSKSHRKRSLSLNRSPNSLISPNRHLPSATSAENKSNNNRRGLKIDDTHAVWLQPEVTRRIPPDIRLQIRRMKRPNGLTQRMMNRLDPNNTAIVAYNKLRANATARQKAKNNTLVNSVARQRKLTWLTKRIKGFV